MAGPSVIQRRPETPVAKPGLVYPGLTIPFILVVTCFAAWGSAANLTDVLVGVFRHIFSMSNFQSALVQFAYYGAYFSLAIPAALINKRYGYKTGVLTGLALATPGGLLFIPARLKLAYLPCFSAGRASCSPTCRSSSPCSCWHPGCPSSRPRPTPSSSPWARSGVRPS